MSLTTWFEKGMTFDEYRAGMKVNVKQLNHVYEELRFLHNDLDFFHDLAKRNWRGVVLTADWCGDAALNVPVIQRIAEEGKIELRYLIRDENLELMDQYLTNGTSRAIPIFIFIDESGAEVAVWGPRANEVQDLVMALRAELPPSEAPDFEEKQKNMYRDFRNKVTSDPEIWRNVIDSVKACFVKGVEK
ncbi:thioredoxin family protein [Bacillus marasmi]|uniref:thioredoxin family protein n=1 Tax=Bacillus marasmi TaxID=1926279 RepID=UPI0011C8AE97|nr:thioredoxin family protein [Bacillus marasmi]